MRTLALTLFLVAVVSAEALAQKVIPQKSTPPAPTTMMVASSVEDRLEYLESEIKALKSEIQALESENHQLKTDLQSTRSEAETARSEVQSVQQQLDDFTSGLYSNGGGILTVHTLKAENVVAETVTPGVGNIW